MKKYKVGIIGIGRIAHVHIEALRMLDNVEVFSISSRNDIEQKAKNLHIYNYYSDYKTMIDNEALDSVHICTSNDVHFEIASYALNKGLHVILEKPMTMTLDEAVDLYNLSKSKNLVSKIHFHNRFYANNHYVKNHIERIGQIISIHGEYTQGWAADPKVYNWRDNKKYGGNTRVIADVGTHYFDLIEYVSGHQITEVSALFSRVHETRGGHQVDTEDIGVIIYKTDQGAIGSTIISQSLIGHDNKLSYTLSGLKGSYMIDGFDPTKYQYAPLNEVFKAYDVTYINTLKTKTTYPSTNFIESFKEAFRDFYQSIDERTFNSSYANFKDGLHSMKLVDAIYQSNEQKRWVQVK